MENTKQTSLSPSEKAARRKKFFLEMDAEFPPVQEFVATSSGIVEQRPETAEEWENFHENLQFVDGVNRGY